MLTEPYCLQGFTDYDEADSGVGSHQDAVDDDPIPECEGIGIDQWSGTALLAKHDDGSAFADVIIVNVDPNACIDGQSVLGEGNVGIVVLGVIDGDAALVDMLIPWPKRQVFHCVAETEVSVYDHARKNIALSETRNGGPRTPGKRRYRYQTRSRRAQRTEDRRKSLLSDEALARVFVQRCCNQGCTRKFGVGVVRALRTEMHMQSFQTKSMKNLDVHRGMHDVYGGKAKVVTVEGEEICIKAWRIIHNVSLRTFHRYASRVKRQERGAPHGNLSRSKCRTKSLQAVETLRSLLSTKADHMPHMHRTLSSGERALVKVLPAGTRWSSLLEDVNKVVVNS